MKLQLKDKYIYWIAAINSVVLLLTYGVFTKYDTPSYIAAWDNCVSHGEIDIFRTPVYPAFLGICKLLAGDCFLTLAAVLQHLVFLLSVYYFKKMAEIFVVSKRVVWWLAVVYAVIPGMSSWASIMLTESLAISGSVFLFYHLTGFYKNNRWQHVLWVTLLLAFLIMLRPAFIYLFPVCIVAWLFNWKTSARLASLGIAGVVFVGFIYLGYCYKFKEKYGVFTTSSVSAINQSCLAFMNGLMQPEFTDNEEFREYIKESQTEEPEIWKEVSAIIERHGLPTVQKALEKSYRAYPVEWMKKAGGRFYRASQTQFLVSYHKIATITDMIGMTIQTLYLILFVYAIILLRWLIKTRTIRSLSLLFWMTNVANLFTAVVGAQAEWERLILPSMPLFFIMICQAANYVKFSPVAGNKDVVI